MRLEWIAIWLAKTSMGAPPAGDVLRNYIPADMGRIHRSGEPLILADGSTVSATYLDLASRKTVTVTIAPVVDAAADRAPYKVWGESPGTLKASEVEYGGFSVGGVPGGYFWTEVSGAVQSEAAVLVGDQLLVRVAVSPAKDPTEPARLMKELDLNGLRTLVP